MADNPTWTLEAFMQHFDSMMNEMNTRFQQRFDAQEKQMALALTAADRAVLKAEAATEKRFESVNEFRQALTEQSANMATKESVDTAVKGLAEKIDSQRAGNLTMMIAIAAILASVVLGVITVVYGGHGSSPPAAVYQLPVTK